MAHMELSEAFIKNDYVYIDTGDGKHYNGTVSKQDHQWLFTSAGVFNLAHPDVKVWRKVSDIGLIIDANQDQRDQLTTRLSLRRDK